MFIDDNDLGKEFHEIDVYDCYNDIFVSKYGKNVAQMGRTGNFEKFDKAKPLRTFSPKEKVKKARRQKEIFRREAYKLES